jgi:hypothetical protein
MTASKSPSAAEGFDIKLKRSPGKISPTKTNLKDIVIKGTDLKSKLTSTERRLKSKDSKESHVGSIDINNLHLPSSSVRYLVETSRKVSGRTKKQPDFPKGLSLGKLIPKMLLAPSKDENQDTPMKKKDKFGGHRTVSPRGGSKGRQSTKSRGNLRNVQININAPDSAFQSKMAPQTSRSR